MLQNDSREFVAGLHRDGATKGGQARTRHPPVALLLRESKKALEKPYFFLAKSDLSKALAYDERNNEHIRGVGAGMGEASTFTVGEWTVTPTRCLLEGAGRSVRVKPRTMQLLAYLASHAGEVVSVDELIASVWQGRVVSNGAIYLTINQLRRALGDDKGDVRFIQTLPKQGYRLVAPVATVNPETSKSSSRAVTHVTPRMVTIGALGLLVVAVGVLLLRSPLPNSIAVLPFSNESAAEQENVQFASGIHNETLTQLGKVGSLTVIARRSVMEYQDSLKSAREIGRELGVATVLLGQVQRAGDMVRINVQLVDAESDEQLWTETYDDQLTAENIFSIQSEIATAISSALNATLTPEEVARLNEVPTRNLQARLHYQTGVEYASGDDMNDLPRAVEQFKLAIKEDPRYALAWTGLSLVHSQQYTLGHDPSEKNLRLSFDALETAKELAPDLPEVHLARAQYHANTGDRERTLIELEIASRGMPNNADLHLSLAQRYRRMGHWEQAIEAAERARDLDPRNYVGGAWWVHLHSRNYSQAQDGLDEVLLIRPDTAWAHVNKAQLPLWQDGDVTLIKAALANPLVEIDEYYRVRMGWIAALYQEDWASAQEYADSMEVLYEGDRRYIPKDSYIGVTYQLAGEREMALLNFETARGQIEQALEANDQDARLHVSMGEVLVGLNEIHEAVRYAHQAIALMPRSRDAIAGPRIQIDAIVRVFAPAGEVSAVIEELDDYLAHPGIWSLEGLLPDPRFDRIQEDPDFQVFVESRRR